MSQKMRRGREIIGRKRGQHGQEAWDRSGSATADPRRRGAASRLARWSGAEASPLETSAASAADPANNTPAAMETAAPRISIASSPFLETWGCSQVLPKVESSESRSLPLARKLRHAQELCTFLSRDGPRPTRDRCSSDRGVSKTTKHDEPKRHGRGRRIVLPIRSAAVRDLVAEIGFRRSALLCPNPVLQRRGFVALPPKATAIGRPAREARGIRHLRDDDVP